MLGLLFQHALGHDVQSVLQHLQYTQVNWLHWVTSTCQYHNIVSTIFDMWYASYLSHSIILVQFNLDFICLKNLFRAVQALLAFVKLPFDCRLWQSYTYPLTGILGSLDALKLFFLTVEKILPIINIIIIMYLSCVVLWGVWVDYLATTNICAIFLRDLFGFLSL